MVAEFGSPACWRERAWAMAEQISDPDTKEAMVTVARSYERIAQRAEARSLGIKVAPT